MKLASINIEKRKHLNRIRLFYTNQSPSVICLQEVYRHDVEQFAQEWGCVYAFAPMSHDVEEKKELGVAIVSAGRIADQQTLWYGGNNGELMALDTTTRRLGYVTQRFILLCANVQFKNRCFQIVTTHFPVTTDGKATDYQRSSMARLIKHVEGLGECILCGDFNTPRGGEMFTELNSRYTDEIPLHYTSSIDPLLHRAAPLELMVDGLFTTPTYTANGVLLHTGVSDHCAITAHIKNRGHRHCESCSTEESR